MQLVNDTVNAAVMVARYNQTARNKRTAPMRGGSLVAILLDLARPHNPLAKELMVENKSNMTWCQFDGFAQDDKAWRTFVQTNTEQPQLQEHPSSTLNRIYELLLLNLVAGAAIGLLLWQRAEARYVSLISIFEQAPLFSWGKP